MLLFPGRYQRVLDRMNEFLSVGIATTIEDIELLKLKDQEDEKKRLNRKVLFSQESREYGFNDDSDDKETRLKSRKKRRRRRRKI